MRIFGGKIVYNDLKIIANASLPDSYVLMNMNDLLSAFITLFSLMVVNNWFVIVNLYVEVMDTVYVNWFFFTFYFFCVVLTLNIVVAFILEMYDNVA